MKKLILLSAIILLIPTIVFVGWFDWFKGIFNPQVEELQLAGTYIFPYQGGTGTSTTPIDLQLLLGRGNGTYYLPKLTAGTNITISTSTTALTISSTGGAGGGSNWKFLTANAITPTSTIGIIVNASSTFTGDLSVGGNLIFGLGNITFTSVGFNSMIGLQSAVTGDLYLQGDNAATAIYLSSNDVGNMAILNLSYLTANRTFAFPDIAFGTFLMATGTQNIKTSGYATSTGLNISGITGSTQCLQIDTTGNVSGTGSACGAGTGGGSNWNVTSTNFGVQSLTTTTSIPVWIQGALYASSTLTVSATTTLNNDLIIDNGAVKGSLIPYTNSTYDLGNSSKRWRYVNTYATYMKEGYLDDYITHTGDTNTTFGFISDQIYFQAGGVEMFRMYEGVTDYNQSIDLVPYSDSAYDLGTSALFFDETYTDELVLQQGTMGATAADQVRLAGLDLSAGDAGLHIMTENDTQHLIASKIGFGTTTPTSFLSITAAGFATTTVAIGSEAGAACLKLRDTDLAGWTYCRTLDGVMTCSTVPCE